ncbi:MAG: hypothetical protein ACHQ01_08005 [Candidatus Limnocylindrales bacterium]
MNDQLGDTTLKVELLLQARRLVETSAPGALRGIREGRRMSVWDVQELTGLFGPNLSLIERGKRRVPATVAGLRYAAWLLDPRNEP